MSNTTTNASERTANPTTSASVLLGAVVTLVATPLSPFAAVLGGATASYHHRASLGRGALLGTLSGALLAVPASVLAWYVSHLGLEAVPAVVSQSLPAVLAGLVAYLLLAGATGGVVGVVLRKR